MIPDDDDGIRRKRKTPGRPDAQPYALNPLLQNIRLADEGSVKVVRINCLEYWGV